MKPKILSPGEVLRARLDEVGMTQSELARIIGRPTQAISEIVSGKKRITAQTATQLAAVEGLANFAWEWLERDSQYQLSLCKVDEAGIRRRSRSWYAARSKRE